jgi:hypothetical protein
MRQSMSRANANVLTMNRQASQGQIAKTIQDFMLNPFITRAIARLSKKVQNEAVSFVPQSFWVYWFSSVKYNGILQTTAFGEFHALQFFDFLTKSKRSRGSNETEIIQRK